MQSTFKRLAVGASAFALLAGFATQAHAVDVYTGASAPTTSNLTIAEEYDFTNTPTIPLTLVIAASDDPTNVVNEFPDTEVQLTIQLPDGVSFDGDYSGYSVNANGEDGAGNPDGVAFALTPSTQSYDAGANTITIVVNTDNASATAGEGADFLEVTGLKLTVEACPSGEFSVGAVFANNPSLAIGSQWVDGEDAPAIFSCVNAYTCSYGGSGIAYAATEHFIELETDYTSFVRGLGLVIGDGDHFTVRDAIVESSGLTVADGPYVDETTFDIVFEDASGIGDLSANGAVCPVDAVDPNVFHCTLSYQPTDVTFEIETYDNGGKTTSTDQIATQQVTIENVTTTFDTASTDLIESEVCDAEADADNLQREGQLFGYFDWVEEFIPENIAKTNNVFRVSGFDPDAATAEDVPFTITILESEGGIPDGTSWGGVISADDIVDGNGVVVLKSKDNFGGVVPAGYDRADFQFFFETEREIDMDRLTVQAGEIFEYGDGVNVDQRSQASGDGNNTPPKPCQSTLDFLGVTELSLTDDCGLNFEDLVNIALPAGYAGFNWSNIFSLLYFGDRYPSFDVILIGASAAGTPYPSVPAEFSRGTNFDLESADFIGASRDNLTVTVEGYDDNVRVATQVFVVDTTAVNSISFNADFNSIDRVVITRSGGSYVSGDVDGDFIWIENLFVRSPN